MEEMAAFYTVCVSKQATGIIWPEHREGYF
jgi:hypothetical protein